MWFQRKENARQGEFQRERRGRQGRNFQENAEGSVWVRKAGKEFPRELGRQCLGFQRKENVRHSEFQGSGRGREEQGVLRR